MTLVELPSREGKLIAVNPHRVSGVQPYFGYRVGSPQKEEMSVIWVDGHNIYICAWTVEAALEVLNAAKRADARAFEAGYRHCHEFNRDGTPPTPTMIEAAFLTYLEGEGECTTTTSTLPETAP